MDTFINLLNAAVLAGTPLLFATLGEIITERSGNINLGVEGMMFMGAASGIGGAYAYEKIATSSGGTASGFAASLVAMLVSFVVGALAALIYSFLTVTLRSNQNVTGLTLTIFGVGFGNFLGEFMGTQAGGYVAVGAETKAAFSNINIPGLSDIPYIGKLLFQYNWMVYFGILVAIIVAIFFKRTRTGLNLMSVGESPATADAAGISVTKYKYLATCIGGGLAGIGGMYVVMVTCSGVWVHNCVNGLGWIAVALVIFSSWNAKAAILGSLVFGGLSIMRLYVPLGSLPMQIYDMMPYIATILVLIITSIRQSKEHCQPKSCGINYFREER